MLPTSADVVNSIRLFSAPVDLAPWSTFKQEMVCFQQGVMLIFKREITVISRQKMMVTFRQESFLDR